MPLPNDLQAWLDQQEREILIRALKDAGFNRTATAARLGISVGCVLCAGERLNFDDIYRADRFVKSVRVLTFKDVNVEELQRRDFQLPEELSLDN